MNDTDTTMVTDAVRAEQVRMIDRAVRYARQSGYCDQFERSMTYLFNGMGLDVDGVFYDSDGVSCRGATLPPVYGEDGFDQRGFNRAGINRDGWSTWGMDADGYDPDGYDTRGINREGWSRPGPFNRQGYDADGFNQMGYDRNNRNRWGFYSYRDESPRATEGYAALPTRNA